jgi:hypothetical protein
MAILLALQGCEVHAQVMFAWFSPPADTHALRSVEPLFQTRQAGSVATSHAASSCLDWKAHFATLPIGIELVELQHRSNLLIRLGLRQGEK